MNGRSCDPDAPGRARGWTAWLVTALVAAALAATGPEAAAQQSIGGQVVDAAQLRPVAGAQVFVEGTSLGMLTDNRGRFLLLNVPGTRVTVRVVMLGYREFAQEVDVGSTGLVLQLEDRALELDAIVVTGTAGGQLARSLGNSVGVVETSMLEEIAPSPDVQTMLSPHVPGLRLIKGGGEIGSGGQIRIRGASSMSLNSEPLLYIDGVRVDNNPADGGGVGSDGGSPPSRMNDLNPDDIESIEVIKGPAAATLYGTEASNGVIQVITKKGRTGAPTITVSMKQGANWLPNQYEIFPDVYYTSSAGEVVGVNLLREEQKKGLGPWFTTGHAQSYAASVSGGSESVRYYFSADFDGDEGAVSYNWQDKFSGRANLSFTPNDRFDFNFNLGGVRSKTEFSSAQQPLTTAIIWGCPAPGCEPGSGAPNALDGPLRGFIAYLPERYEDDIDGFEELDRNTVSFAATFRPFEWMTHKLTAGGDFGTAQGTELRKRLPEGTFGTFELLGRKSIETRRSSFLSIDYGGTGVFQPTSDLELATSVGVQFYQRESETVFGEGTIFPVRELETISSGSTKTASETFLQNKTFGLYVQEQLSWKNRVFLTGAVRGDDNSAFGTNFDFVVYPKLSASWVVSEESFFDGVPLFTDLRLRAAWGKAGQQPDVFSALRTYEPAVGQNSTPTLTPENVGNADLEPEVGEEIEVGFDASLFSDRLGVEFSYYRKKTTNAIVQVPALPSMGFPGTQFRNLGEISNRGFEVGLDATVYEGDDVDVAFGLTFSRNINEVDDIGGVAPIVVSAGNGQFQVPGFPLGAIFQKRVLSADLDGQGRVTNLMCEGGELVEGSAFLSRGGGPAVPCDVAPDVFWGGVLPTWEGAFSASVTLWRDLRLFGLLDFIGGHKRIDGNIALGHHFFRNTRMAHERDDPIFLAYEALQGTSARQTGILDAGFAKLRTVSATYTLPDSWASGVGASRLTVTVSGDNLWTAWLAQEGAFGTKQIDPEIQTTSNLGFGAYVQEGWPQLRRFLTTFRVTF